MAPRAILLAAVLLMLCHSFLLAADDVLTVTQDESAMETAIARFLKAAHGVTTAEKALAAGDLALIVPMSGNGGPDFSVLIDTQPSARAGGKVAERTVTLEVLTGVKVAQDKRSAVLEAINKFAQDNWFATMYIDETGELACRSCVNVTKQGLPAECVADGIDRLAGVWRGFCPTAAGPGLGLEIVEVNATVVIESRLEIILEEKRAHLLIVVDDDAGDEDDDDNDGVKDDEDEDDDNDGVMDADEEGAGDAKEDDDEGGDAAGDDDEDAGDGDEGDGDGGDDGGDDEGMG